MHQGSVTHLKLAVSPIFKCPHHAFFKSDVSLLNNALNGRKFEQEAALLDRPHMLEHLLCSQCYCNTETAFTCMPTSFRADQLMKCCQGHSAAQIRTCGQAYIACTMTTISSRCAEVYPAMILSIVFDL